MPELSTPSGLSIPAVHVTTEGATTYHGLLCEIGSRAVGFAFLRGAAPELQVGERCELTVRADRSGASVALAGRTLRREEDLERISYRVEVGDDSLTALAILIERRGMQRVDPGGLQRCLLFSLDGSRRIEATLEDLSATGLRVGIPAAQLGQIEGLEALTACTLLPGDEEPLELMSLVRNVESVEGRIEIGLEFVAHAAGEFVRTLERVERFVRSRQAQVLRTLPVPEPAAD